MGTIGIFIAGYIMGGLVGYAAAALMNIAAHEEKDKTEEKE